MGQMKGLGFFLFLLCSSHLLSAQSVGVVLSGGGSKGMAHIGVLKALEEERIPIDYIAGTSIGAVIGGLYASGFSVDSLEQMALQGIFEKWVSEEIKEKFRCCYKEPESNPEWVDLKFRIDSMLSPKLPVNLINPVYLNFAGMHLFAGAQTVSQAKFDQLMVPFFCVASDIQKNKAVYLTEGDLFSSIRASMTFPLVFQPISIDGRLLFDGGVYDNYPVEAMIERFDPDIIIGSVVSGFSYVPLKEDDVRSHLANLVLGETNYYVPQGKGVSIFPNLPQVGLTNFEAAEAMIDSGYSATKCDLEGIMEMIERRADDVFYQERRQKFNDQKPGLNFKQINIRGLKDNQTRYIKGLLKRESAQYTIKEVEEIYFKILAEPKVQTIETSVDFNDSSGFYDLDFQLVLDEEVSAAFGGNISSTPVNQGYFSVAYRKLSWLAYEGKVHTYFGRFFRAVGANLRLDFTVPTPFYVDIAYRLNHYDFYKTGATFFEDPTPSFLIQNQNFWRFHLGKRLGRNAKIFAGFTQGRNRDEYYQTNDFRRQDKTDRSRFFFFAPQIGLRRNTLNRRLYPTRGTYFSTSLRQIDGTEDHRAGSTALFEAKDTKTRSWWQWQLTYERYFKQVNDFHFGFWGQLLWSDQPLFNNYTATLLATPGFDHVPETRTLFLSNYIAAKYATAGLKSVYTVTKRFSFRLEGYVFQPYRPILRNADDYRAELGDRFSEIHFIFSAATVLETRIGPLSLTLNYLERDDPNFSLLLNFGYLIFNKHPYY